MTAPINLHSNHHARSFAVQRRTSLRWAASLAIACATTLSLGWPSAAQAGAYDDFFKAIELDNARNLQALLRRGFDPNTRNPQGQPALVLALREDARAAAAALLAAKDIKIEQRNAQGESPLMLAALRGNLEAAQALIERDADINQPGWTPLHYAASSTSDQAVAMVKLLLEHHAYIDAASPNGTTPLMMATRYGLQDVVRLLLEEGADPNSKNELGLNAADFARQAGRDALLEPIAEAVRRRQPKRGQW